MAVVQSCNDEWEQHYTAKNDFVSDKTLWDAISTNPDLTIFSQLLKENGYDKILSG